LESRGNQAHFVRWTILRMIPYHCEMIALRGGTANDLPPRHPRAVARGAPNRD
jgi:hypothetical protein